MAKIREDFMPTTSKAQKLRKLIRECIDMSSRAISLNFPLWDELEMSYRAWRPIDDDDRESLEKHGVQKIIVPIQFATVQTMLTFMMEVFTALKPVLRVRGAEPSSIRKARVMEVALDYDYRGNRGYFLMQQWFFNAFRYGYGIKKNTWGERTVLRKILTPSDVGMFNIAGFGEMKVPGATKYSYEPFTTFEGNEWKIVDNRSFFPDPRYPLSRFQEGNFCGERDLLHDHDLFELEDQDLFFNTTKIKSTSTYGSTRGSEPGDTSHSRDRYGSRFSLDTVLTEAKKNKMHLNEEIIIKLIPKDYELSEEDRPQYYLFNLIDDSYICRAEPNPFIKFPYSIVESYPDILAFISQGVMELTGPLAAHLNFLFNSHMANVRKAVNDRFLADPSKINLEDFLDPENSVVRLLPQAYGSNPAEALQQLSVVDITRNHMADVQGLIEFWEKITGASQHMFGQISSGRRTAFELQGVFRQAGARMKMTADLFSSEGVAPLTEQMALLRQENMSMEQFMEIAGQTAADLGVNPNEIVEGFLKVNKDHLDGVFNYPAEEGVLPQDRAAAAEILEQMFQTVAQAPFLMQVFDPVEIFKETVRQKGLHNIDDFLEKGIRAETMIMTPDQVGELYAKNKIQPMAGGNNGGRRQGELTLEGALNGAGSPRQPA